MFDTNVFSTTLKVLPPNMEADPTGQRPINCDLTTSESYTLISTTLFMSWNQLIQMAYSGTNMFSDIFSGNQ